MSEQLPKPLPEKSTASVLADAVHSLVAGLTGLASASRSEIVLSIGHIFQRMRGGAFLETLLREWNRYREAGRVKDDYQETEQHKVCLQQLLDFLDRDSPDELRFNVLKKIFLVAAAEAKTSRDSLLPQQYMQIARQLSDGEVLVLNACYRAFKDDTNKSWRGDQMFSAGDWLKQVADISGLEYPELVELHERGLEDKKLITARKHSDRSGVTLKPYFRLTSLGLHFCEFIAAYEET